MRTTDTTTAGDSWGELIGDFVVYMKAAQRSPGTIRLYRYKLLDLAELAEKPAEVTTGLMLELLSERTHWKPETVKSTRTAWRAFFRWAVGSHRLEKDPALDLPPIMIPAAEPRPAADKTIRESTREASERERLMILLGAYAGLRCCEIATVHSGAWDGRTLMVTGKGGKTRAVPIRHAELVRRLDGLEGWAFPNRWSGEPLTAGHVTRVLSRALGETATGHMLRHRFATVALESTKDLLAVGQVLGHSRPETTQRYCKVGAERLEAVAVAAAA